MNPCYPYKRLLDICYNHQLHHLSSYFSSLHIIDDIYSKMNKDDIFILSNGHAVVSLYVILEKYFNIDAEELKYLELSQPTTENNKNLTNKIDTKSTTNISIAVQT